MLVLSRKTGESIELPGLGVVVRVLDVKKSRIEIGIDAPRDIAIRRGGAAVKSKLNQPTAKPVSTSMHPWAKIEARIAALAELASPDDQDAAQRIASEAIEQLHAVRYDSAATPNRQAPPIRLSEFVTVRTDVLDELRRQNPPVEPTPVEPTPVESTPVKASSCVRQAGVGYSVSAGEYSFTA